MSHVGGVTVMATGVFDLLHPGHLSFLKQAKALGDRLVVVVTNDTVAHQSKGETLFTASERAEMIEAIDWVDEVIIPTETDPSRYYLTVAAIKPAIIALGYDQRFDELELAKELAQHGLDCQIVRLEQAKTSTWSSTKLKKRILTIIDQRRSHESSADKS
ncbi:MAG: cytidyltransferase-related enzyme [Candidatus Berkelbacteria bacterium Gr01-1014_85]|uniref:Cytidyltransferase-related enzyme n=1 Tax=Candidatus Berkelbacteria bacterium Gr01-1014_85 TaxID=2017150 RepID=A0A554JE35_9BACT|nr:MAG: cytidyltransferase-related enzyme [Candidatus Berkelbacteria bacterium Gr01-1014_85]